MNLFQLFLSNRKKREPLLLESVRAVLFLMYFLISLYLSFNKDTLLFGITVGGSDKLYSPYFSTGKCTNTNLPFLPNLSKCVLVALIRGECPHDTASKRYRAISQPLGIFRAEENYFSFGRKFIFVRTQIIFHAEENLSKRGKLITNSRTTN